MSYKTDFAPPAAELLWKVRPRLGWKILDAVDRLCDNPVQLSWRSYFPGSTHYQMYETAVEEGGERILLTIFFRYAADEQTLLIEDMVATPLE